MKNNITLGLAIICDNAFIDQESRLSIIQAFDVIESKDFPTTHPKLVLVLQWEGEDKFSGKQTIKIISPDDKVLTTVDQILSKEATKHRTIGIFNGLVFRNPGTYKFDILFDEKKYKSLPIKVVRSTPGGV